MKANRLRWGLALGLGVVSQLGSIASAQPLDFEVVGPAGMLVEITAFGQDGVPIFSGKPLELQIDGLLSLYKARATDTLPGAVVSWCVTQVSPQVPEGSAAAEVPKLCTEKTAAVADTLVFPAPTRAFDGYDQAGYAVGVDGVTLTAVPDLPNSITCVQEQLAALGADVGTADGAFGPKTEKALAEFVAKAESDGAKFSLPAFSDRTATIWCAGLSQIPAALPAFQAFVGKNTTFTPYFSNLILAHAQGDGSKGASVIGNVTLLRKGPTYAVRVSGSGLSELVFAPTVQQGVDPVLLAGLTAQLLEDPIVVDILAKGLAQRGLGIDTDLTPALAQAESVLRGQVPWSNEDNRFDLFAALGDGSHAIYLVFIGKTLDQAKLLAFAVLDRK